MDGDVTGGPDLLARLGDSVGPFLEAGSLRPFLEGCLVLLLGAALLYAGGRWVAPALYRWFPWLSPFLNRIAPFALLTPFMAIFLVFRIWPLVQATTMSFQNVQGIQANEFVGLQNYQNVFANPSFGTAMINTFVYTIMTLIILIPLPLALAALLDRGGTYKPMAWRMALFIPALASLVVVSVMFRVVLAEDGLLNSALNAVGLPPQAWLTSRHLAIPALLIIATWRWVGINMLYFNSGLVNITRELYEAAAIDGARGWQMFWHITVPLMKPTIVFVLIISVIGGFQLFVEPFLLWAGGNSPSQGGLSMALLIYRTAFTNFKFGDAAAMGVVLALVILIVSAVVFRLMGGTKALR